MFFDALIPLYLKGFRVFYVFNLFICVCRKLFCGRLFALSQAFIERFVICGGIVPGEILPHGALLHPLPGRRVVIKMAGLADARAQCVARRFVKHEPRRTAGLQIFRRGINNGIGQTLLSITLIPK